MRVELKPNEPVTGRLLSALPLAVQKQGEEIYRYYLVDADERQLVFDLSPEEAQALAEAGAKRHDVVSVMLRKLGKKKPTLEVEVVERADYDSFLSVGASCEALLKEIKEMLTNGLPTAQAQPQRAEEAQPEAEEAEVKVSQKHVETIVRGFAKLKVDDDMQIALANAIAGREVASMSSLTEKEAARLINYLAKVARGEYKLTDIFEEEGDTPPWQG